MNTLIWCGVDLGGTKIVVALVSMTGKVVARKIIHEHRTRTEDEIVAMITQSVRGLVPRLATGRAETGSLAGVGVGTSGHVNFDDGVVISNSNLPGFSNYPLSRRMSEDLGIEVAVDNDANAQAYAEYRFGAARGFDNVLFVTVSTGLGSGIIIEGKLYRGATGTAGEIGHTIVNPAGQIRCGCGNYGCLMAHTSGLTLPGIVREKLREYRPKTGINFAALTDDEINGELIKSGLDRGDELCMAVVAEYAHFLGIGLHNVVQILNPGVIILGGGLIAWGRAYLDRVRETFYSHATKTISDAPEIRLSELGADGAVIGAAALAMTKYKGQS